MQAAPLLETVTTSLAAARGVFEVVQRCSRIDSLCEKGMRPPQLENRAAYQTKYCLRVPQLSRENHTFTFCVYI